VLPLPANSDAPAIPVSWTEDGSPPDLRDFTIYLSRDGGPYQAWRLNTTAIGDTLVPPVDHRVHRYAFYSVARDMSGNIESPPSTPDASTQSRTAVGDTGPLQFALGGAQPNPARGALHVGFTLPNHDKTTLDVIDISGRRVLHRDVGSLGPGRHLIVLEAVPALRPGLYFLRLAQGTRVLTDRVAVIR
jgi:hypothetical protein